MVTSAKESVVGRSKGRTGRVGYAMAMSPSDFICSLPCAGGLEGAGRGMVVCPYAQPGGSPWGRKLAGAWGSATHIPTNNSVTVCLLVMTAVCLCHLLLTPTMTLAIQPSKGISKIGKIQ